MRSRFERSIGKPVNTPEHAAMKSLQELDAPAGTPSANIKIHANQIYRNAREKLQKNEFVLVQDIETYFENLKKIWHVTCNTYRKPRASATFLQIESSFSTILDLYKKSSINCLVKNGENQKWFTVNCADLAKKVNEFNLLLTNNITETLNPKLLRSFVLAHRDLLLAKKKLDGEATNDILRSQIPAIMTFEATTKIFAEKDLVLRCNMLKKAIDILSAKTILAKKIPRHTPTTDDFKKLDDEINQFFVSSEKVLDHRRKNIRLLKEISPQKVQRLELPFYKKKDAANLVVTEVKEQKRFAPEISMHHKVDPPNSNKPSFNGWLFAASCLTGVLGLIYLAYYVYQVYRQYRKTHSVHPHPEERLERYQTKTNEVSKSWSNLYLSRMEHKYSQPDTPSIPLVKRVKI